MRLQSCSIFFALVAFLAVGTRADHPVPVFLTVPKWQNGDSPSVILPSAPRNQGSITTSIQGGVGQSNTQQSSLTILPSQNTVLSVPEYGIYFNGLVMNNVVNVYYIFYGQSWSSNQQLILTDLIQGLNQTAWYQIQTTYTDINGVKLKTALNYKGSISTGYNRGRNLTADAIWGVVTDALVARAFPVDPDGIYFVIGDQNIVTDDGYCSLYCAYHDYNIYANVKIKFAFTPNTAKCLNVCASTNFYVSPNGDPGVDNAVDSIVHELVEAASDPQLGAWFNNLDLTENADRCVYQYLNNATMSNGALYNLQVKSPKGYWRNYLAQANWVNSNGGSCIMGYPSPTPLDPNLAKSPGRSRKLFL